MILALLIRHRNDSNHPMKWFKMCSSCYLKSKIALVAKILDGLLLALHFCSSRRFQQVNLEMRMDFVENIAFASLNFN